jgi:hypothetical protein
MCLLNTTSHELLELLEFYESKLQMPRYAILSHTWSDNEVTFAELGDENWKRKKGGIKILNSCARARNDGLDWIWIDTCCAL